MSERSDNETQVRAFFDDYAERGRGLAARFGTDVDAVMDEASTTFDAMIPTMAYVDDPARPMASNLFSCSAALAVYLALRERGVDAHAFGAAMLEAARAERTEPPSQQVEREPREARWAKFEAAARASQRNPAPGEFVFEAVAGGDSRSWGLDITSCAICHAFSRYDAMDLVPYMCATDDVESEQAGSGLRRTGTIALGARRCDFRFRYGGDPLTVAEQFPDRIRLIEA